MKSLMRRLLVLLVLILAPTTAVMAQQTAMATIALPASYRLIIPDGEPQRWNNCGPATLTNGLKFFGYVDNQVRAAEYLKPNEMDKNVSPWQMVDFVNTQVPELPVYALTRVGGTLDLMKTLLSKDFPVIIEEGYDPEPQRLGWMGHYLLLIGYDDAAGIFTTHDSYLGPNKTYTYEHIDRFWQHFNRTYIVIYDQGREDELLGLLGADADAWQNTVSALETARAEAIADDQDPFAWFNMGTNFVALGMYQEAAIAYDQARNVGGGLPWRMLWYQFGPYEAYLAVGRYDDVIALAHTSIQNGTAANETLFQVEETYYYAGRAREAMGEIDNALNNYNAALAVNTNFTPAREARDRLQASQ